jgi:Beta-lactamase./Domain of unknown function (DUF3471).
MRDSSYDSTERIVPRRVTGYDKKGSNYVNCEYLSMTHPHAAGALISTVDDFAKWDEALYTNKLVEQESLAKAWTSFRLNNGQLTNYGYGWLVTTLEDERMLSHSGGVNGFACYTVRLPDAKVYVAILSNRETGAPGNLANRIAAKIAGIEIREPVAIQLPSLEKYVGVYGANSKNDFHVALENGSLFFRRGSKPKQEILPLDQRHFFFKERPSSRLDFILREDSVDALVVRSWLGPDEEAKKN